MKQAVAVFVFAVDITLISLHIISLVDVVLDPDTAHPNIVLSADGKQAGRGELLHIVLDNPQRFDPVICVVGKRGFLSGRFYFQVSVLFNNGFFYHLEGTHAYLIQGFAIPFFCHLYLINLSVLQEVPLIFCQPLSELLKEKEAN